MANIIGPKANNQVNMSEVDMFVKFLSNPNTQIPVDSNFLIHFESLPPVFTDSKANPWVNFEENWDVKNVSRALIQEIQNQVHGPAGGQICLFANGINIPGESVGVERTDPLLGPAGGLVGGVTTNMRIKYSELTISFLETNKSFIDFVIRPWITLVGHYGLISRASTSLQNVKIPISVYHFDKNDNKTNAGIRRVFKFNACAPVSINESSYAYGKSDARIEGVRFVFNNYRISYDPNQSGNVPVTAPATTNKTPAANNAFISNVNNAAANPGKTPLDYNNTMLNNYNNSLVNGFNVKAGKK